MLHPTSTHANTTLFSIKSIDDKVFLYETFTLTRHNSHLWILIGMESFLSFAAFVVFFAKQMKKVIQRHFRNFVWKRYIHKFAKIVFVLQLSYKTKLWMNANEWSRIYVFEYFAYMNTYLVLNLVQMWKKA